MVIWRVPNHISLVNPKRSFCPNCEAPIAWYGKGKIEETINIAGFTVSVTGLGLGRNGRKKKNKKDHKDQKDK